MLKSVSGALQVTVVAVLAIQTMIPYYRVAVYPLEHYKMTASGVKSFFLQTSEFGGQLIFYLIIIFKTPKMNFFLLLTFSSIEILFSGTNCIYFTARFSSI